MLGHQVKRPHYPAREPFDIESGQRHNGLYFSAVHSRARPASKWPGSILREGNKEYSKPKQQSFTVFLRANRIRWPEGRKSL